MDEPLAVDVLVAGAGIGGICAALQAARSGAHTLLVERGEEIGGTGVHSPLALVCGFRGRQIGPVNYGIHRELFPEAYDSALEGMVPVYDHERLLARYRDLIAREPLLEVRTGVELIDVECLRRRITAVSAASADLSARVFLDGTADGNLAALAGAKFQQGRERDGATQPATLTFMVDGIDIQRLQHPEIRTWAGIKKFWAELEPYYAPLRDRAGNELLRENVLCFPYPDGTRVVFNQTRICGVDPTDSRSVARAEEEGRRQIGEFFEAVRRHPALHSSRIAWIASRLGVREGRRVEGDYMLTAEDCLGEVRFPDMIAACAYDIDIHNPDGRGTVMKQIPGSGYYHIPYRCLIPQGLDNLLLASRCISGTHEAHSSYRVMSSLSGVGQAAGAAAALFCRLGLDNVRDVDAAWIRHELKAADQFVEGSLEPVGSS